MNQRHPDDAWETWVRDTARHLPYPPTPDLRARVGRRSPAPRWVRPLLACVVVVLLLLGLVPEARAAIGRVLGIGSIRFIWPAPAATVAPVATTVAPLPSPTAAAPVWRLSGETTLATARERAPFAILLPAYPPDLQAPDRVFFQDLGGPAVILVWTAPDDPEHVVLSLHVLSNDAVARKLLGQDTILQETAVRGERAVWLRGGHVLMYENPRGVEDLREGRLVEGNVLIWSEAGLTYRVEGAASLDEAVRVAESLR